MNIEVTCDNCEKTFTVEPPVLNETLIERRTGKNVVYRGHDDTFLYYCPYCDATGELELEEGKDDTRSA